LDLISSDSLFIELMRLRRWVALSVQTEMFQSIGWKKCPIERWIERFVCSVTIAAPQMDNKIGNQMKSIQAPATDWQCQENYDRNDQGHYQFHTLHTTVTALLQQNGAPLFPSLIT